MPVIKKILSFYNCLIIYSAIILLFNILLLQVPLARVFGYEFSVLNSVLLVFLAGLYYISTLKKLKKNPEQKKNLSRQGIISAAAFLFLPASVSLSNSLLMPGFPLKDGVLFYIVITFPSVLIGFSLASFCVHVFKKFHKTFFIILYFLILLIPAAEFYLNPQIYCFNPIIGYLPGTIYDEALSVNYNLIIYRLLNVLYFGLTAIVLYRCITGIMKIYKWIIVSVLALTAALFYYFSPVFGFSTTFSRLDNTLDRTAVTSHFIIHYPPQLNSDFVKALEVYHEYYYKELKEFFGYEYPGKINSYLFLNNEQKKELFGSANADFAKPWMNCAFLTCSDYQDALKHELAHCYSSVIGAGPLKIAAGLNPYLTEGLAVAAYPVIGGNNVDYLASLAYNNKYKANLEGLFDRFSFYTQASLMSYIYAGSFSRYLIREYGMQKFKELYNNGDFISIYKQPLKDVVRNYYTTLTDTSMLNKKDEANYYFGRKSIFYKVYPRFTQEKISEGWNCFYKGDYNKSKEIFGEIIKITNEYSAISGYAECLYKTGSAAIAAGFLKKQAGQFKNSAYYYSLEMKLGDMLSLSGDYTDADSIYSELILQNPNFSFFYLANLRHNLLNKDTLIASYLLGNDFDKYNILKDYLSSQYDYSAIPVIVDLAGKFDADYDQFMKIFDKNFEVQGFIESYAMFKLSNYMVEHLDFERARKVAALAMNAEAGRNFDEIAKANFDKINWFYHNYKNILSNSYIK